MTGKKSPPGYPKRPKHRYNFFLSTRTAELRAERDVILAKGDRLPHDHPLAQPGLITKYLGEEWQQIKYVPYLVAQYERMAEDEKRQYYLVDLPRWKQQTAAINNHDTETAANSNHDTVATAKATVSTVAKACNVHNDENKNQQLQLNQLRNFQDDRKPAATNNDISPIDMIDEKFASPNANPSEDIIQWASEQTKRSISPGNTCPALKRLKSSPLPPPAVVSNLYQLNSKNKACEKSHSLGEESSLNQIWKTSPQCYTSGSSVLTGAAPTAKIDNFSSEADDNDCLQMLKSDKYLLEQLLSFDCSPHSDNSSNKLH